MRYGKLKRGIAPIVIAIMVAVLFGGALYVYKKIQGSGSLPQNTVATTTPTSLVDVSPTSADENPATNNYDPRGNWDFSALNRGVETKTIFLLEGNIDSGVFTNGDSLTGKYSLTKNEIKLTFAGGSEYSGVISNPDNMSGKTLSNGSSIGDWNAKRNSDIKTDIRGNWQITETDSTPTGPKIFKYEVIMGYMKTQSSVPPSMNKGKIIRADDVKNVMDYSVYFPASEISWATLDGFLKYTGKITGDNAMGGEFNYSGYGGDVKGTWTAERVK